MTNENRVYVIYSSKHLVLNVGKLPVARIVWNRECTTSSIMHLHFQVIVYQSIT